MPITKLINGFRHFKTEQFDQNLSHYLDLSIRQEPKVMVISCCDSRVDPAIITHAEPGEIFMMRNVANIVPACETSHGYHGTSAAIEYAVKNLKVDHIIILGHWGCGGIRSLMETDSDIKCDDSYISAWMALAKIARERTLEKAGHQSFDEQCHHCELESLKLSLDNLKSFPFVMDAVKNRGLKLHAWYFDLKEGTMHIYDEGGDLFKDLDHRAAF